MNNFDLQNHYFAVEFNINLIRRLKVARAYIWHFFYKTSILYKNYGNINISTYKPIK